MNYELDKAFPKTKEKKINGLITDKLSGKIIAKFFALIAKTFSYLIDNGSGDKKGKGTKKWVITRKIKFYNY